MICFRLITVHFFVFFCSLLVLHIGSEDDKFIFENHLVRSYDNDVHPHYIVPYTFFPVILCMLIRY